MLEPYDEPVGSRRRLCRGRARSRVVLTMVRRVVPAEDAGSTLWSGATWRRCRGRSKVKEEQPCLRTSTTVTSAEAM